ncbi:hypothetical protein GCM10027271_22680 [Saccharopolyspora gloriosae]
MQVRESAQQRGKRRAHLHPRQRRTHAVVHAVAAFDVVARLAGDVEGVRVVHELVVPVRARWSYPEAGCG